MYTKIDSGEEFKRGTNVTSYVSIISIHLPGWPTGSLDR